LQGAQRELKQEKERLKQWKEACSERERIEVEIGRLRAAANWRGSPAKCSRTLRQLSATSLHTHRGKRAAHF